MHCGYHRGGTTWFNNVLNGVAECFGLRYQNCEQHQLERDTEIYLQNDSNVDLGTLRAHVGSHMVRDPRDLIVSGYFFHLWTDESWAHVPRPEYAGKSYQEHLNGLDQHAGLLAEIRRTGPNILRMLEWDFDNPAFIELRYEDMIADEEKGFREIFAHYGFSAPAIERSMSVVRQHSFRRVTQRNVGEDRAKSHLRSGKPGQWQDLLTEEHRALFKDLYGDALERLGYAGDGW